MWLSAIFLFWIHEFGGLPLIGLIRGIMIGAFCCLVADLCTAGLAWLADFYPFIS